MIYDFAFTWAVVALIVLGATACGCAVQWLARRLDFRRWEASTEGLTVTDRAVIAEAEAIVRAAERAGRRRS